MEVRVDRVHDARFSIRARNVSAVVDRLEPVVAEHPERVSAVHMTLRIGGAITQRQRESLQRVGQRCKIHNTLHADVETVLTVEAPEGAASTGTSRHGGGS